MLGDFDELNEVKQWLALEDSIRIKLLKIGAAVVRNTRRVRLLLASSHPLKHVFLSAAHALPP